MMMTNNDATQRRHVEGNNSEMTDYEDGDLDGRAHHALQLQQHQWHDHHLHYRHPHHQLPRHANGNQDVISSPTSRSPSDYLRRLSARHNQWRSLASDAQFAHSLITSLEDASEAGERLNERGDSGSTSLSHRYIRADLAARFLDEFSLLFEDEDEAWSDDELWELGIQGWLALWDSEESWHGESEPIPVTNGLSKSLMKHIHKEVYVAKGSWCDDDTQEDDCSVCLEHFVLGQSLTCLPCKHRFHSNCLSPWLENHGQCPYCRANVLEEKDEKASSSSGSGNTFLSEDDLLALMEPMITGFPTMGTR